MQLVLESLAFALRKLLKLIFFALLFVLVLCLLAIGVAALAFVVLRALLTGRRPQFATTFTRFRDATRPFQQRAWPTGARPRPASSDVVDVEATEVPHVRIEGR